MNTNRLLTGFALLIIAFVPSTVLAQEVKSPMLEHLYNGNWPGEEEAQELRDELFYNQAIQAYMTMLPALNTIGLRDGSEEAFGSGYNVLPIWKDRMDARAWVPTPNADIVYAMGYLDLAETGPLVVAAPPGVIGMFTDFFQRTITDVGAGGPDRALGGLYLLLPPGYDGYVPDGYFDFKSRTNNVFLFFRALMGQGENGVDPTPGVMTQEKTRIYPLWDEEKNIPAMEFPNGSGKRINMMYPVDFAFWEKLKAFIDEEPVEAIDPELRGILAAIGIVKGHEFAPTERERALLVRAVERAPKMILASRMVNRPDKRDLYYEGRQWQRIWAGGTNDWMQESYLDVVTRNAFFQIGYSTAPAMVKRTINQGSKYPVAIRDADGELLHGSNTYMVRLPAGIPVKLFWAVTLYNVSDGTMPETDQLIPGVNGYDDVVKSEDGSIELYFGPTKPEGVADANYIKTLESRAFLVGLRIYGSGVEFFDQTWIPDDVVRVR
jgi:hypothetical protein